MTITSRASGDAKNSKNVFEIITQKIFSCLLIKVQEFKIVKEVMVCGILPVAMFNFKFYL